MRSFLQVVAILLLGTLSLSGSEKNRTGLPSDLPVEIQVGAYVIDVFKITGADQSFYADIALHFKWQDPRLANPDAGTRILPLDQAWHPDLHVVNLRSASNTRAEELEVEADGTVNYHQRLRGTFSAQFDLREFPNDEQQLFVQYIASGYRPHQIRFLSGELLCSQSDTLSISDWEIGQLQLRDAPYRLPQLDSELPGLRLELHAERYIGYYLGTVFSSAAIIVCMAWMVFWIDPSAINPRVSISVTSMLTLIAHRFVIQKELPHLPYLTKMDFFLLGSTLIVLIGLIGVVTVNRALSSGDEARTKRWNTLFKYTYPIAFVSLLVLTL